MSDKPKPITPPSTGKQQQSIGGLMVKMMIEQYEQSQKK
jgi:hypothetical protein